MRSEERGWSREPTRGKPNKEMEYKIQMDSRVLADKDPHGPTLAKEGPTAALSVGWALASPPLHLLPGNKGGLRRVPS